MKKKGISSVCDSPDGVARSRHYLSLGGEHLRHGLLLGRHGDGVARADGRSQRRLAGGCVDAGCD